MLQVNFIIIYISHKTSELPKITRTSKHPLRNIIDHYLFKK